MLGGAIAFLGAWILFKTQLDNLEGMVRAITDILWTGSRRVRAWRGGDVRAVYYSVLAVGRRCGASIALRLAQPIVLLKLGANVAGVVFIVASLHLLYINTRLLPRARAPAAVAARGAVNHRRVLQRLCRALASKRHVVIRICQVRRSRASARRRECIQRASRPDKDCPAGDRRRGPHFFVEIVDRQDFPLAAGLEVQ